MLNFRTASILFLIILGGVTFIHSAFGISWWWIAPVFAIYILQLAMGSARINSGFYTTVYCEAKTNDKKIAITFDDGPTSFTPSILKTLAEYNVPATFFMIGKNIASNENIVKQIVSEGHSIGNHTFTHSFFIDFKTTSGFKKELQQMDDAQFAITGNRLKLFRPPYGVTTPHLVKAAKKLGYYIIGWNIRSLDTTNNNEQQILKRVTDQIKPGAIILFHDTSEKTNRILNQTLRFIKENRFTVVHAEQLLNIVPYS